MVLGVSTDSVRKHAKFKAKYALPYTLVSDGDHAIADAYGVWGERTLFGIKYMGVARTTFLIDPEGRIVRVFEKVKVDGHADEVAAAIETARPRKRRRPAR